MLGFAEFDAEDDIGVAELLPAPSVSLSLALSAMAVRRCVESRREDDSSCSVEFEQCTQQNSTLCDLALACCHSAPARMSPVLPIARK